MLYDLVHQMSDFHHSILVLVIKHEYPSFFEHRTQNLDLLEKIIENQGVLLKLLFSPYLIRVSELNN